MQRTVADGFGKWGNSGIGFFGIAGLALRKVTERIDFSLTDTPMSQERFPSICARVSKQPPSSEGRVSAATQRLGIKQLGEVAERPNAPVLKTGDGVTRPRVRIPASPLFEQPVKHKLLFHGLLRFAGLPRMSRLWRRLWRFVAGTFSEGRSRWPGQSPIVRRHFVSGV